MPTAGCGGPAEVDRGALRRLRGQVATPADLLALAPPDESPVEPLPQLGDLLVSTR